jgi:SWI/SNF-related matrix-associated actin-dependent regulator of chromatin subfamily A-like protein 1
VRVLVANIIAGGVGLHLTAARQVVFNDLDWVPSNHWQAEDRAYRIGQTNTVHVTYVKAGGTVDDFVGTLLETKAAIIGAVVEGRALQDGVADGSVLDELQRLLSALSPHLADTRLEDLDEEDVARLLREAAAALERKQTSDAAGVVTRRSESEAMRHALALLEQALSAPSATRYTVASSSRPGQQYTLEVDGADEVTCGCPGFGYRGQCSHARTLKTAMARGAALPAGYVLS